MLILSKFRKILLKINATEDNEPKRALGFANIFGCAPVGASASKTLKNNTTTNYLTEKGAPKEHLFK